MKRLSLLLLLLTGCSTAPVADLLDYFRPGRIAPDNAARGGVCGPQQPGPPVIASPGAIPAPVFPASPPAVAPGVAQPVPGGPLSAPVLPR
jgi:hypothetical protein